MKDSNVHCLQSIITRLEGLSNDDIDYSYGYQDIAEIIFYDFKEQTLDLIQDTDLWEIWIISVQLTQNILFQVNLCPRQDDLLDEIVDGAWHRRIFGLGGCHVLW